MRNGTKNGGWNRVRNGVPDAVRNASPTRPDQTRPELLLRMSVVAGLNQVQIVRYVTAREANGLDLGAAL